MGLVSAVNKIVELVFTLQKTTNLFMQYCAIHCYCTGWKYFATGAFDERLYCCWS